MFLQPSKSEAFSDPAPAPIASNVKQSQLRTKVQGLFGGWDDYQAIMYSQRSKIKETETDRDRDRQTDRQRQTETDRKKEREKEKERKLE